MILYNTWLWPERKHTLVDETELCFKSVLHFQAIKWTNILKVSYPDGRIFNRVIFDIFVVQTEITPDISD